MSKDPSCFVTPLVTHNNNKIMIIICNGGIMWYLHVIGSTKSRGQGDDGVRDRSTLFLPPHESHGEDWRQDP